MLDGGCFMKSDWVREVKLHHYKKCNTADNRRFVVMGEVNLCDGVCRINICFKG